MRELTRIGRRGKATGEVAASQAAGGIRGWTRMNSGGWTFLRAPPLPGPRPPSVMEEREAFRTSPLRCVRLSLRGAFMGSIGERSVRRILSPVEAEREDALGRRRRWRRGLRIEGGWNGGNRHLSLYPSGFPSPPRDGFPENGLSLRDLRSPVEAVREEALERRRLGWVSVLRSLRDGGRR